MKLLAKYGQQGRHNLLRLLYKWQDNVKEEIRFVPKNDSFEPSSGREKGSHGVLFVAR